ncbi:interferon regulatory factor 9 [Cricetulus griseus]
MASGKARCTRKLRSWIIQQLESGHFPGVCWDDTAKTMFRIPWKHAGKQDFRKDQDAAIFKAWALFKKKHKDEDIGPPAVWKTRLRCALNKSPEFEEVPERGRMDVAEPYKVYRILPPGTLPAQPRSQKSPSKRPNSAVSPEREENKEKGRSSGLVNPSDCGSSGGGGSGGSSSGYSSSSSPEPEEGASPSEVSTPEDPVFIEHPLPLNSDYSLLLTFIYSGRVVGEITVESLDCRLVADPSVSESNMPQVVFPTPDPLEPIQHLLSQLERGILVASNSRGLFVQRLCPIPVSWNAPEAPPGPGPHLLPSNKCVELFSTTCFSRDLAQYCQGQGPPPKFQATLHFWEERPGSSHTQENLITVQAFPWSFASLARTANPDGKFCFLEWLAATRGSRLVKREYLKVNVVKTCEEILNYVLVRVQPPMPGLPRPRFSLYLSAQLQIGVIRVYSQQCQYLVEDIQHILERLHRAQMRIRIDMEEADLPSLLLPNCLAMMETLEDAPEPFFGTMSVDPGLPSPFDIPQGEQDLPEVSRGDLDLLIAEEDDAILLEERQRGRLLQRRRASPALDAGWLPPELLALWTHCAQIPPRMLRQRPQLEPEEVAEEERRKTEALSEIEVLREAQEPSGPLMISSELSLEAAEEEKSRTSLIPPEERWAWIEEGQPEPPALPMLPEIPEVPMEMPPGPELLSSEAVLRAVALELQANREPDFSSLVPPLSPRKLASRVFSLLLAMTVTLTCWDPVVWQNQAADTQELRSHICKLWKGLVNPGSNSLEPRGVEWVVGTRERSSPETELTPNPTVNLRRNKETW